MSEYIVVKYNSNGNFDFVISGLGKNKNTLDTGMCKSSAYRYAKELNASAVNGEKYKVESQF